MSTQTIAPPQPTIAPDVRAFARERAIEVYLQPLIDLTQRVYPSATKFAIFLEEDRETGEPYIVFELNAALDVQQSLAADKRWGEEWMRIYPSPRTCVFCKSVNLIR